MKKSQKICNFVSEFLKDARGELVLSDKQFDRLVKIGKVAYRVTSIFEGKKDIDKVIEKLAIKNAMNESKNAEKF